MQTINNQEFSKLFKENHKNLEIIDVREKDEYDLIKIRGSRLIPLSQIENRLNEIDWSKKVIMVCRSGSRSAFATQLAASHSKEATNLQGGIADLYFDNCDCLEKSSSFSENYF